MITWKDVCEVDPSVANVTDDVKQAALVAAATEAPGEMFDGEDGPSTRLARMFIAAHRAKTDQGAAHATTPQGQSFLVMQGHAAHAKTTKAPTTPTRRRPR